MRVTEEEIPMRSRLASTFFLLAATALIAPAAALGCSSDESLTPAPAAIHSLRAEQNDSGDYTLVWDPIAPDAVVEVTAGTSTEAIDHQKVLTRTTGGTQVTVSGLDTSKRWYFEVGSPGANHVIVAERHVRLRGAANYRDIGGYLTDDGHAVRWGIVYRSDALGKIDASDLDYIGGTGVKLAIDLRSDGEVTAVPDVVADGSRIAYRRGPIELPVDLKQLLQSGTIVDEAYMLTLYEHAVDKYAAVYAQLVSDLADASTRPVVFHCTAGKDRTGIAAALVLSALGVSDEVIAQDFALTDTYLGKMVAEQEALLRTQGIDPARLGVLFKSPPALIRATLTYVRDKYGSVEAYLRVGGLDAATFARVRATLRTP